MSHKYKLKYSLGARAGEFDADELRKEEVGGSDALIIFSLLYPDDGSFSMDWFGLDGRNTDENGEPKRIDDLEVFKVWCLLANRLSRSETLPEGHRQFAASVFFAWKHEMIGGECEDPDCACHEMGLDKQGGRREHER